MLKKWWIIASISFVLSFLIILGVLQSWKISLLASSIIFVVVISLDPKKRFFRIAWLAIGGIFAANSISLFTLLSWFGLPLEVQTAGNTSTVILGVIAVVALILDLIERKTEKTKTKDGPTKTKENIYIYSDTSLPKTWVDKSEDSKKLYLLLREPSWWSRYMPGPRRKIYTKVLEIQALGGSGKSCFVRNFLNEGWTKKLSYDTIIWFSFYKLQNTVDPFHHFVDYSLPRLDPDFVLSPKMSSTAKRNRLEEILRERKVLVVLDGFEVVQVQEDGQNLGQILRHQEDFKLLLRSACNFPRSQVIITSRQHLIDLSDNQGFYVFQLTPWTGRELQSFLNADKTVFNHIQTARILDVLGSHPLTLTAFKFLFYQFYQGKSEMIDRAIADIQIKSTAPPTKKSTQYEVQINKLSDIYSNILSELTEDEKYLMQRIASFYGEVYEDDYTILLQDKTKDKFFFDNLLQRFVDSSLIARGYRGSHTTYSAHPMLKTVVYNSIDKNKRINIHKEISIFFGEKLSESSFEEPNNLADLDPLMEWFQQCVNGNLFNTAFDIWKEQRLKDLLYFGGWFKAHLELIESLSSKAFSQMPAEGQLQLKMTLGHITRKLGRLNEAIEHFSDAFETASTLGNEIAEYEASIEVAISFGFKGEFMQTLKIMPQKHLASESYYDGARLEWLGYATAIIGETKEGIDLMQNAIELCRKRDDLRHLAPALTHLGDIYLLTGSNDKALATFEESLQICLKEKYSDYEGDARRGLGDYLRLEKKFDEALREYSEAKKIAIALGYRYLQAESELGLAKLLLESKRFKQEQLQDFLDQGLYISLSSDYNLLKAEAYLLLAKLRTSNPQEFKDNLEKAEILLQKVRHYKLISLLTELKGNIQSAKG